MLVKKNINSHYQGRRKWSPIFFVVVSHWRKGRAFDCNTTTLVEQLVFIFKHEIAIACCFPSCFPCTSPNTFMKNIYGKAEAFSKYFKRKWY